MNKTKTHNMVYLAYNKTTDNFKKQDENTLENVRN